MDIQKITTELLATGLTQQELADLAECSQSSINAFANGNRGTRPSLTIGLKLMELHSERCGNVAPCTRRVTDPAPGLGRCGRQATSPHNILDTVPDHAVVSAIPTTKD